MPLLSDPLEVVSQALNGFGVLARPLSVSIRDAIRAARLTEDYSAVWWLTRETIEPDDDEAVRALSAEMLKSFDIQTARELDERFTSEYTERRRMWSSAEAVAKGAKDHVQHHSVGVIEQNIIDVQSAADQMPSGTTGRLRLEFLAGQLQQVLERIRNKVHDYLAKMEQRLVFERRNQDVFDEHIAVVDGFIEEYAPDVLEMFTAVYERLEDPKPEHLHQAGTTCRRILKAVADHLYPPGPPIRDSSGRERKVGEDQYVNRLLAFAQEHLPDTVGAIWGASLNDLSARLDGLNELASKGVHAPKYALFEARHCAMQTYLVVGDLLRLQPEDESD
jgi:hypothetical protein